MKSKNLTVITTINIRPDPHPLDFDWRFEPETLRDLINLIPSTGDVLSIGVPSVINEIQSRKQRVLLVDRHPIQNATEHLMLDPGVEEALNKEFTSILVDSPWYPEEFKRWINWGAQALNDDGVIYASIWPDETRPNAVQEKLNIFNWLKNWAEFEVIPNFFRYTTPNFEVQSLRSQNSHTSPKLDWRTGDLLIIRPKLKQSLLDPIIKRSLWHRFIVNNYQLAVKVSKEDCVYPRVFTHESSNEWFWTSVSKRASGRDEIGLWSSENEVARTMGSKKILEVLRAHFGFTDENLHNVDSEEITSVLSTLEAWALPKKPFKRVLEWQHQD